MDSLSISVTIVPGVIALLLLLVFTYLHEQSRREYFRAWQIAWAAYTVFYGLQVWQLWRRPSAGLALASSLLLLLLGLSLFVSTRLLRQPFHVRWYDLAVLAAGLLTVLWNYWPRFIRAPLPSPLAHGHLRMEVFLAAILLYCSAAFYVQGQRRGSVALQLLSFSLALWAVLAGFVQPSSGLLQLLGGSGAQLGPIPQILLGISMVVVLFEDERNAVQQNALAFSTLGVDPTRLLTAEDLVPSMQRVLERLVAPLPTGRAMICISDRWRATLASVQRGFSDEFLRKLEKNGAGEYICEMAYRRGGFVSFRNVADMQEPLPAFPGSRFEQFRRTLSEENMRHITAVSLQTREHNFGAILFPHAERWMFASSNLRLLTGLALQIGLTLENYVVMHDAQRRTKEYELLTQIGQAISARLDQEGVLRAVQKELGQIFDTSNFYIAFQNGDSIGFELEVVKGEVLGKRSRPTTNGLTEYMLRTGQPLLIRSEVEKTRERLGVELVPEEDARSFCGAPILLGGRPAGVMAAMNMDREYAFEPRDLAVMQTAAGQVSVAVENARLFAEEQRRSRQFAFLNNISKTAISSEDSAQMLADIVAEIQKNFRFDHIGIGILDYATKQIEIKAEAGATTQALGRQVPLGTGILGRVARTGESALVQTTSETPLQGLLPQSRAVLCIPISYGDTLLGVLNVESRHEDAFSPQDVLILNTLADLLATALHNSFVFQKLQQQSITDGLTGLKTRRFFWESLSSEWKRASRSGRPFSVVLIDLDKFKEVNDGSGHLEGDLVLTRVGRLLEQKCRQSNVVARYGGDEFIILMPETGVEQAQVLAERLRLWLATDPMLSEHQITGSFGVASFPVHGFSAEDIIRVADAGLYDSKHAGGDRVCVAEGLPADESTAVKRQLVSGYIEGFLQREHTGPEHLDELTSTLKRLCGGDDTCDTTVLRESVESLARAAETRETNATGHGELTARYAELIARALGLPAHDIEEISYAARAHDVGKIFLPERILNKPGPLTDDEYYLVKLHARVGSEIVAAIPGSEQLSKAIEHHHEAFDGSGYPAGLRGEQIPLWARILAVCDAYVNMTTERSFSSAKTGEAALAELEKLSGVRFDGMLVRVLRHELKSESAHWTLDS
ncbi:MAG TPA: diguanylate cyclase [Terriglobales bacterium]|nr:diguanylate cyclase [Terriglobales bacterium]